MSGLRKQYKPYPKYKPSGVEWIGEIPEAWEIRRWRFSAKTNPPKSELVSSDKTIDVQFLPMELIPEEDPNLILDLSKQLSEVYSGYTYFRNGDILIAKITPCFENGKGALVESLINNIGFGTTELHVFRPLEKIINKKYLFLISKLRPFREIGESMMKGSAGQKRVPELFIKDFMIPIPTLTEQQIITNFLDLEIARTNTIVAKQRRLIELFKEKRAALITHAVTKGLDPHARMKDSGVEWIGEIPEVWEVKPLKRIADIKYGIGGEIDKTLREGRSLISLPNVKISGEFDLEEEFFTLERDEGTLLKTGDLLFNWRNGSSDHLGKTAYFNLDGNYTHVSFLLRIRFKSEEINSKFFFRLLNGLREKSFFSSSKAGVNNTFNQTELKNLLVMVPPKTEQDQISELLDHETVKIDTLISKIEKQIELLTEYKQSLITAAVTGKIDVRDEKA